MPRTIEPARKLPAKLAGLLIADGQGFPTRPVPEARLDLEGFVLPGLSIERHRGMARAAEPGCPGILVARLFVIRARSRSFPPPNWLKSHGHSAFPRSSPNGSAPISSSMASNACPCCRADRACFSRRRGCRGGGSELAVPWTRPGYRCTVPRQGSTRSRFRQGRHASQGLGGVGRAGRHDT